MGLEDRSIIKLRYFSGDTTTPDVANAAPIQLYITENRNQFGKETSFIPIARTGDAQAEDARTLALDLKEVDDGWNITGFIKMDERDDQFSLPSVYRDSNNNGVVSGADDPDATITTTENLTFTEFGDSGNANTHSWHLLGAKRIDPSSFLLEDSQGNTLTEETDYNVDYNRGLIEVFNNGGIDTVTQDGTDFPDETLKAGYKYRGRNDTIARIIKRMSERGGQINMEVDPDTYSSVERNINAVNQSNDYFTITGEHDSDYLKGDTVVVDGSTGNDGEYTVVKAVYQSGDDTTDIYVDSEISSSTADGTITLKKGIEIPVQAETVDITQAPDRPNEVEVSLDLRQAVDKET